MEGLVKQWGLIVNGEFEPKKWVYLGSVALNQAQELLEASFVFILILIF